VYTTPVGSKIEYNVESLVNFLTSTKDFRDPVTRIPYALNDILRLDKQSRCMVNSDKNDLLGKFTDRTEHQADVTSRQRLQELQSLETCLGEMISDMQKVVEKRITTSDAELRLSLLFSEFEGPYAYMKSLDIQTAYVNLMSWIQFIKGPPKRPTLNPSGSLNLVIDFLKEQFTASDKQKIVTLRTEGGGGQDINSADITVTITATDTSADTDSVVPIVEGSEE
jgi:hypothetical protein